MTRWIVSTLGASTLLAAGLVMAPPAIRAEGDKAEKADKHADRRVEVRMGGGRLGVRLTEVGKDDVARLKLPGERGALVQSVEEGSAAEKAGIKDGDVILRYQGEAVQSAAQLARMVRETPSGRAVTVELSRGGAPQTLTATLGEGPDRVRVFDHDFEVPVPPVPPVPPMAHLAPPEMPELPEAFRNFHWNDDGDTRRFFFHGMGGGRKLGVQYQEISGQLAQYFKLGDEKGVLVTSVEKDAPAAKAGIRAGDVILKFDGKPVKGGDDLRDEVRRAEGGKEVTVTVQRDGRPLDLKVQLAKPDEPRHAGGVSL